MSFFAAAADSIAHKASEVTDQLKAQAEAFKTEKLQMLKEFEAEKKRLIAQSITGKLNNLFEYAMRTLCEVVKEESTDDDYMPECVKTMIRTLIDSLFPDFKAEVKDAIMTKVAAQDHQIAHGDPPCCPCSPIALCRYWLYPYDRNIWRMIRNPFWWLCFFVSLVPRYGVAQCYYLLLFLLIDKNDEFQLVKFISDFKSLQFFNLGLISSVVGSVQYFICTSQVPETCSEYAPQESVWTIAMFVAQVIIVWVAFALISCSHQKGGVYFMLTREARKQTAEQQAAREDSFQNVLMGEQLTKEAYEDDQELAALSRSRLMALLIYDLIVFLLCVALTMWVAFGNMLDSTTNVQAKGAGDDNWKFESSLYWIKAAYGLLSLPFVVLMVPGLKSLFSHAKPTGYNPYGNTVPLLGQEEDGPVPWDPQRQPKKVREQQQQAAREPAGAHAA